MSERSHTVPTPEGEYFESNRFAGLSSLLGLIAIVALALCVVGAFLNPHQFSYSWLFAFAFYFTLCAGCFFWTIVHHATDANWSVVVRRQLENIGALLVCWRSSLCRSFFFDGICIPGWTSRPVSNMRLMRSAPISIGLSFCSALWCSFGFFFARRSFCAAYR